MLSYLLVINYVFENTVAKWVFLVTKEYENYKSPSYLAYWSHYVTHDGLR